MSRTALVAAGSALVISVAALGAAFLGAKLGLSNHLEEVALANLKTSRLGLAAQQAVLRRQDYLPVLGSCEMRFKQLNRIDNFFASKPTGFRVEPIGQGGNTDLLIAQTCAALGPALQGKKLVVIISPEWFFNPRATDAQYAGNFSVEHALATLTSPLLDDRIKQRVAARMAEYPETLRKNSILEQLVPAYKGDIPNAVFVRKAAYLAAVCYQRVFDISDPLFTWLEFATKRHPPIPAPLTGSGIDWRAAREKGEHEFQRMTEGNSLGIRKSIWKKLQAKDQSRLHAFEISRLKNISTTVEWEDFAILLEVLRQLDAKPLILAMPINGRYFQMLGADKQAWEVYYSRLREAVARCGFPFYDFEEYENDPRFRGYDDLNPEGWLCFDKVADAFYHDRLSEVPEILRQAL
jgi:D-alanine transfer protein